MYNWNSILSQRTRESVAGPSSRTEVQYVSSNPISLTTKPSLRVEQLELKLGLLLMSANLFLVATKLLAAVLSTQLDSVKQKLQAVHLKIILQNLEARYIMVES